MGLTQYKKMYARNSSCIEDGVRIIGIPEPRIEEPVSFERKYAGVPAIAWLAGHPGVSYLQLRAMLARVGLGIDREGIICAR